MEELKVGTAVAEKGKTVFGQLKVAELSDSSPVNIPVIIVQGKTEGPTLLLTSTIHGPEITGTEVIRKICREIVSPDELKGTIIALPICNPFAYRESSWTTPEDGMNLNRSFPGQKNRWLSESIARDIFDHAVLKSDYIVDFHCMCDPTILHSAVKGGITDESWETSQKLAKAFGLPSIELRETNMDHRSGTMISAAERKGIYGITVELRVWRRIDKESVKVGVRGTLNVMRTLGMIDGSIESHPNLPSIPSPLKWLEFFADRGGIVHFMKDPGEMVQKDEVFIEIRNPFGDLVQEFRSSEEAVVIGYPLFGNQAVGTGEMLAFLGAPIK